MIRQRMGCAGVVIAASIAAAPVASAAVYSYNFDSGLPAGFSGTAVTTSVDGLSNNNGFSGGMLRSSSASTDIVNNNAVLSLSGLAAHDTVTLSFGLGLLDSWDGTLGSVAPDYFNILADGVEVFEISVGNASGFTSEVIPASATNRTSGSNLYGSSWNDKLFDVSFSFSHSASTLELDFFADGGGWQGEDDEYWAIDNLRVETSGATTPVPLPGGMILLVGGLGALGALRRRRG